MNVLIIGDSHSYFLNSFDGIKYPDIMNIKHHWMGPSLCKSLTCDKTTLNTRTRILKILKNEDFKSDVIIFSFGEIDCRFHIAGRLNRKKDIFLDEDMKKSIKITALRYVSFLYEINLMGYNVISWAPIGTNTRVIQTDPANPSYGTIPQRNKVNEFFTEELIKYSNPDIKIFSILKYLIDENYNTRNEFYADNMHLNDTDPNKDLIWKFVLPLFIEYKKEKNL